MITPAHDSIAQHARELWQERGCPDGCDTEIWLDAERRLRGDGRAAFTAHVAAETAARSPVAPNIFPEVPQQEAIQTARQKSDARAPQVPHHTGAKAKPAETGKPLWQKAHSR